MEAWDNSNAPWGVYSDLNAVKRALENAEAKRLGRCRVGSRQHGSGGNSQQPVWAVRNVEQYRGLDAKSVGREYLKQAERATNAGLASKWFQVRGANGDGG